MKTVTPSETAITVGQIGKIQELLGAALRKSELQSEPTQLVLETQGDSLVAELISVVRKRVDAAGNRIVRRIKVDRTRTPEQMLKATGRKQYVDHDVVAAMPKGEGSEAEVFFFNLGRFISDADLEKEYALRGLKPADPYTLGAVNEADPSFTDTHYNATHWKNADGKWCYTAFNRWHGVRYVFVHEYGYGWRDFWWFAGVRK